MDEDEAGIEAYKKIKFTKNRNHERFKYELIRKLINLMVDDLIKNTKKNLAKMKIKDSKDILENTETLVVFSEEMLNKEKKLKNFLKNRMYNHPRVKTMNFKAKKVISDLFDLFIEEPYLLPPSWRKIYSEKDKFVNVADYISGMTDNFAINIHKKYFDLYSF